MTALLHEKIKLPSKREDKKETVSQPSYQEVLEKLEEEASLVGEEPPAWHEAIVEARYKEWMEGKIESRSLEEVFKELKAELGIK